MATKNPRVPITLDPILYEWVVKEAKRQGISISLALRDAVKFAYEWKATLEVLSSPELMKQLAESQKLSKKDYIPFEKVKRNVYRRA